MKNFNINNTVSVVLCCILLQACMKDENFPGPDRCGDISVITHETHEFDLLFGTSPGQLASGEISASIILPDGDTAWLINNATLNSVAGQEFLRNCIVRKNGLSLSVKYSVVGSSAGSLIPEPGTDQWYTINSGIFYNGSYQLVVSAWQKTGPEPFDYAVTGCQVVELDYNNNTIKSSNVITRNSSIIYGAALLQFNGYTYIYGDKNTGANKEAYLARIPAGSLLQPWTFFDGYNWKSIAEDARPVLNNVSDVYSVFAQNNSLYLVSQSSVFGQELNIYTSDRPESGWRFSKILYCRSGMNDHLISFNTKMHFTDQEGNMICSYSLFDDNLQNSNPYMPGFINIRHWQ